MALSGGGLGAEEGCLRGGAVVAGAEVGAEFEAAETEGAGFVALCVSNLVIY